MLLNTAITILIAILAFGVLIFIHELGHFIAAKKSGVRVNEFSLGMGPAIFHFNRGETQYSIRLFPIGGYVAMEGELEDSSDGRAFCNVSIPRRLVIMAAGAAMNILLGLVLIFLVVTMQPAVHSTVIGRFAEGATTSQKLQLDDEIVAVNGAKIFTYNDIIFEVLRDQDAVIDMTVIRDGVRTEVSGVPFSYEELDDGSRSILVDFQVYGLEKTVGNMIGETFNWTFSIIKQVYKSIGDLITGRFGINQLTGPVGVATVIGQASSMGLQAFLLMVGFITINLGVMNLLPFPALDGGRIVFLLIEAARGGRPVSQRVESFVNAAGLGLLLVLMIYVTFQDVLRIVVG